MDLNLIITLVIIAVFFFLIIKFIKGMTVNIYKKTEIEKLDPTSTGERLKKYIIQASKMNPKTAKSLYLERTEWGEGGKIGHVVGHITDKDTTSFIIRKHFIGRKYLLYCPVDMHTTLHQKHVIIHGVSIHSAGGYLWPTPKGDEATSDVFMVVSAAFEKDLKRMVTMDVPQIEVEQIYEGITGFKRDRSFYEEPEDIGERYEVVDDEEP
jgi:hypothetical protein